MNRTYSVSGIGRLRMGSDGKGIRTLIVMAGCPLKCRYCPNSYTWDNSYDPRMLTAKEVYRYVMRDRLYLLATNGGVTFGGGEPLLQRGIIQEFAELGGGGLSINVETSLNVPEENVAEIARTVDTFYVDIKSMNSRIYKDYTSGDLEVAVNNLKILLADKDAEHVVVRVPLIPDYNDEEDIRRSREKLLKMGVARIDLFPYRVGTTD